MNSVQQLADIDQPLVQSVTPSSGHSLKLDQIMHRFGDMVALRDINLDIQPGEFVSLLGPSGCGKTTLLRIISGFIASTSGQVLIDNQSVAGLTASQRGVGIVFQNYALFPHMTVWDNVAYGLRAKGLARGKVSNKVGEMLELVQLGHLAKRYPSELSGGQQQRVAISRALAVEPKLMLLDEPFSALDKNLRLDMQIEIRRLLSEQDVTAILVTHDQEEAMSMSDRIAVLLDGEIHQFDSPSQIYDRPATRFVSSFIGTCNLLPAQVVGSDADNYLIQVPGGGRLLVSHDEPLLPDSQVLLAVRPENLKVKSQPGSHGLAGTVEMCIPLGSVMAYEVKMSDDTRIKVSQTRVPGKRSLMAGDQIHLELISPQASILFPMES